MELEEIEVVIAPDGTVRIEVRGVNGPACLAATADLEAGCTLACTGCFNPETHPRSGEEITVDELFDRILALGDTIEGVTISGGEPLQQRPAVLALLARIRADTSLSVLVFTGFTWPEVARMPDVPALQRCVDVLIAGRYDATQRLAHGLRGSSNKTVHLFSDRYTLDDLDTVPDAEVLIRPDGQLVISGINPPQIAALAPDERR